VYICVLWWWWVHNAQVVVVTEAGWGQKLEVSEWCHERGVAFVGAEARGVFGSVFCDFGEAHAVLDPNGEPPFQQMIASVTRDKPGVVTILDDRRLQLETGDFVKFTEVRGMTQLNDAPPRPITVLGTCPVLSFERPLRALVLARSRAEHRLTVLLPGRLVSWAVWGAIRVATLGQAPTPSRSRTPRATTSTSPADTSSRSSRPRPCASYNATIATTTTTSLSPPSSPPRRFLELQPHLPLALCAHVRGVLFVVQSCVCRVSCVVCVFPFRSPAVASCRCKSR
jgi:hypothetical protein